ncbi:MAG TPA: helicase-related protein [Vicinamibacterales bacterium]|nr:helicase-related protein [Vicinamibacterales bacterium]
MPGLLRTAGAAQIDILPYQLEPAVAVLRGNGCRVLIADEVGLGKTIQACLVIAELRARGSAARVLVLAPPGLRDQWHVELHERFRVDAAVVDFRSVRQRICTIPPDVNPWTTWSVAIASVDYVKRPEVLREVLDAHWDVVVVDEAHRVANDGDRRQAAAALAARAAYVISLTATPHSGDSASFESLCSLGSQGDRLLIFRRTRQMVAASARRRHIHRLHVRSTAAERRMLARLDVFTRAVQRESADGVREMWIALALLHKRAYSSAHALHLSVMRRLATLTAPSLSAQMRLPLMDFGEASDDDAPDWHPSLALGDPDRERQLLGALADAAASAAKTESKIQAIRRLLNRIDEPAIVFTEYRDTLGWVARQLPEPVLQLHGGLSRRERLAVVEAFTRGNARVLLATDAAGEGLNLHHRCRVVVNLELPWNPMRLEQRIGRVDRIGQQRAVHAFHLIGATSGEMSLLDELRTRIARAQAAVGAADPLDGALDADNDGLLVSEHVDVAAEASRVHLARALGAKHDEHGRPLIAKSRNPQTRFRLRGLTLSMWESEVTDTDERVVSSHVVGVTGSIACADVVAAASEPRNRAALVSARAFSQAALQRTRAIAARIANDRASPHQPGLFDRRVHFAHAALKAANEAAIAGLKERADLQQRAGEVTAGSPRLRLVLLP